MKKDPDEMRILTYPDPVLKTRAHPVETIDADIQDFCDAMIRTMYRAPGIGLAATQLGELKRIIVFDLQPREEERKPCVLINPEIVLSEGEITYEEACLSVVDFSADVKRNAQVKVTGTDPEGRPADIEAEGLLAICLQHEIDHLDGILYIDRISSLKRALYKKKLRKMKKDA